MKNFYQFFFLFLLRNSGGFLHICRKKALIFFFLNRQLVKSCKAILLSDVFLYSNIGNNFSSFSLPSCDVARLSVHLFFKNGTELTIGRTKRFRVYPSL